jgi:hypothetical protein
MGIAEIVTLVTGFFKFFPEIRKLIHVLSKSTAEKKAEVSANLTKEEEKLRVEGRPEW